MKNRPQGQQPELMVRQLPARIIRRDMTQARQVLREHGVIDSDEDAFVFSAEISNNNLDAYFTRMDESTLRNFANDAKAGVSLQDSHDTRKLGYGQSFDSVLEIDGSKSRVIADFYTIRSISYGGLHSYASTDDFILAVEKGIVRDVSVGFYGGEETCDICGDPVWEWFSDCPHLPGVEYPIGDQGNETVICTASIIDARLSEVSVVYDGATPEAQIIEKAQRLIDKGELDRRVIHSLERSYRWKPYLGIGAEEFMTKKVSARGTNLAAFLNERIDELVDDDTPRSEILQQMADAAGIAVSTVRDALNRNILNASINCPPLERLEGFAEALDVSLDDLIDAAGSDGCEYEEEDRMVNEQKAADQILELLRKAEDYGIASIPADPQRAVTWLMEQHQELTRQIGEQNAENEKMTNEVAELKPKAEDGEQYRSDLIADALEWGVRALGEDFDKEKNKTLLESLPLDQVRQMCVLWQQMGNTRFEGGRGTADEKEPEIFQWKDPQIPDNAFV